MLAPSARSGLLITLRDLRFDNVPSGWSGFSTERFSGWDIISTPVPIVISIKIENINPRVHKVFVGIECIRLI